MGGETPLYNGPYSGTDNLHAMQAAVRYNQYLFEVILRFARDRPGSKLLDFGAGLGTFASMPRARGADVTCLEPVATLADSLRDHGFPVLDSLEFAAPAYDLVYTLNVLEHIEDDVSTVAELRRVLRPGGTVIVYVPAMAILYSSMDRLVGHMRRYALDDLRALAQSQELEILECRYCDPLGFFVTLLYKLIGSREGRLSPRSVATYDRYIFPLSRAIEPFTARLFECLRTQLHQ